MPIRPNMFIIGAPKCGTTSMARWLGEHPKIFMSPLKEPHFFDTDQKRRTTSIMEYEGLFAGANKMHAAVGEASVFYLFSNEAVPNILHYNPTSKFIVMVRNPVEMAHSLHRFYCYVGREDVFDFAEAWALDHERLQDRRLPHRAWDPKRMVYRDVCALGKQVERLLAQVPREHVEIVFLEDVRRDARAEYLRVLKFLGIPDDGRGTFPTHNGARSNRYQVLSNMSTVAYDIKKKLNIKWGLGVLNTAKRLNSRHVSPSEIPSELRRDMVAYFRSDIAQLSAMAGRDLSHWC